MRRYLLGLLGLLAAALLGMVSSRVDFGVTGEEASPLLLDAALRTCGVAAATPARGTETTECLESYLTVLLEDRDAASVVDLVLDVYAREPDLNYQCHNFMHLIGSLLAPERAGENVVALGHRWSVCGSGLVHGAFETFDLSGIPPDVAGKDSMSACARQDFSDDRVLLADCAHSVGHSVYAAYADDITAGERVCAATATVATVLPAGATATQCLGGLYMQRAENLTAASGPPPVTASGWEADFDFCRRAADMFECSVSFGRFATESPVSAAAFAEWCASMASPGRCLRRLSQDLGTRTVLSGDRSFHDACTGIAETFELDRSACTDGLRAAWAIAAGGGARDVVCDLLRESGQDCGTTAPATQPEYPSAG